MTGASVGSKRTASSPTTRGRCVPSKVVLKENSIDSVEVASGGLGGLWGASIACTVYSVLGARCDEGRQTAVANSSLHSSVLTTPATLAPSASVTVTLST